MAHDHHVFMLLTEAAAQAYSAAGLAEYAPRLLELAERDGHQLYRAIARRALGVAARLAGDLVGAEAHLNQAREIFDTLETHWQIGRTLVELAELDRARLDPAAAHQHYTQALAEFEGLQAGPDAARTRASVAALG
jgi:hypothetical protein